MTIPRSLDIKRTLLEELEEAGGRSKGKNILEKLAHRFRITPIGRELRDDSGHRIFDHRVDSVVAQLRIVGWIEPVEVAGRGTWDLTAHYVNLSKDNPPISREQERKDELTRRVKAVEDAFGKLKEFTLGLVPKED